MKHQRKNKIENVVNASQPIFISSQQTLLLVLNSLNPSWCDRLLIGIELEIHFQCSVPIESIAKTFQLRVDR